MTEEKEKAKRPRGSGHIFDRRGIKWIKYHDQGRQYFESTGKRGREGLRAAQKLLNLRTGQRHAGSFIPDADKLRMRDLAALLTADYKAHERKSARRIPGSLAHLEAFYSTTPAPAIASKVPAYIAARLEEKPKPALATIGYEVALLRRCFTLAVRAGLMANRPLIENVHVQNARQGFVDEQAFRKIVVALPAHLRAPIRFAYATAWRRSEWTDLEWSSVDLEGGEIRLAGADTKSGQGRVFPLVGEVKEIIEEQHARKKAWEQKHGEAVSLVFWRPTRKGAKPLGDFRESWEKAATAAGVPELLVHDLRRSRARAWSNAGVPDRVGMALGGWKTRAIYDRYGIVSKADLTDALGKATQHDRQERRKPTR